MKLLEVLTIMVINKLTKFQIADPDAMLRSTSSATNVVEEITPSLASVRQTHYKSCIVTILC